MAEVSGHINKLVNVIIVSHGVNSVLYTVINSPQGQDATESDHCFPT